VADAAAGDFDDDLVVGWIQGWNIEAFQPPSRSNERVAVCRIQL
jgi:hypothetical protein